MLRRLTKDGERREGTKDSIIVFTFTLVRIYDNENVKSSVFEFVLFPVLYTSIVYPHYLHQTVLTKDINIVINIKNVNKSKVLLEQYI